MKYRRKARELSLQLLYEVDIRQREASEVLEDIFSRYHFRKEVESYTRRLVEGTCHYLPHLDSLLRRYALNWTLERMAVVDRNILRWGIYELFFMKDVPPVVTINEAVEIAKKYGTEDSGKFVNGILDRIRRERGADSLLKWEFLEDSLRKDPYIKLFLQGEKKKKFWLVGGYLRDGLLGRRSKDRDFILEDPDFGIAKILSSYTGGTLIPLNSLTRRVVTPEGDTFDFTLKKTTLKEELLRRDFTINTLALDLKRWEEENRPPLRLLLLDPVDGLSDLLNKKIKALSPQVLEEDPLRILRAFRIGKELGFKFEEETKRWLEEKSSLLKEVPGERIGEEIRLSLKLPLGKVTSVEKKILEEVIGGRIYPERAKRGEKIVEGKTIPSPLREKILSHLEKPGGEGLTRMNLFRLSLLCFDGKDSLSSLGKRLKMSKKSRKILRDTERFCLYLKQVNPSSFDPFEKAWLFLQAKENFVEAVLLYWLKNPHNSRRRGFSFSLLEEYFEKSSLIHNPPKILSGKEIMEDLCIPPGPFLSRIVEKLREATVLGLVKTREEALSFARECGKKKVKERIPEGT